MRDHPQHYPKILGGMFGCKTKELTHRHDIWKLFREYKKSVADPTDQDFILHYFSKIENIYQPPFDKVMIHDEIKRYENALTGKTIDGASICRNFPIPWDHEFNFVGQYVYENGERHSQITKILENHIRFGRAQLSSRVTLNSYTVITATNDNPDYYNCFPIMKKGWNAMGYNVILIVVANDIPAELLPYQNSIIVFKPIPSIPTAFQAQNIRLLFSGLRCIVDSTSSTNFYLITDVDCCPLKKEYFYTYLHNVKDFVIFRGDILKNNGVNDQYSMMYCLTHIKTWATIFNVYNENDIRTTMIEWFNDVKDYKVRSAFSKGWATDQLKLYEKVNDASKKDLINILLFTDEQRGFKRSEKREKITVFNAEDWHDFVDFQMTVFHKTSAENEIETTPNNVAPPLYIIHYKKLIERKKFMEDQLSKYEASKYWNVIWVDQFDRSDLTKDIIKDRYCHVAGMRGMTAGEICNAIAHTFVIADIIKNNYDIAMIIEDDAVFRTDNFFSDLKIILDRVYPIARVNSTFDILAIGSAENNLRHLGNLTNVNIESRETFATCGFIITKECCEKLIKHNLFYKFAFPIDVSYVLCIKDNNVRVLATNPPLICEGSKNGIFKSAIVGRW
jgi:glycosyl transferase family 25